MTTILDRLNARITENDRAALERCISKAGPTKGKIRKTAPDWRKDPKAWAAWQALRTALGWHGEFATFTLMMLDDESRKVWDRVSDAAMAVRREIYARADNKPLTDPAGTQADLATFRESQSQSPAAGAVRSQLGIA